MDHLHEQIDRGGSRAVVVLVDTRPVTAPGT